MLKKILILILAGSFINTWSQNKEENTYKKLLEAKKLVMFDLDSTSRILNEIKRELPYYKYKDSTLSRFYNLYGIYYFQRNMPDSAIFFMEKSIVKSHDPKRKASNYLNLANVYRNINQYETSLKYLGAAIRLYEEIEDSLGMGLAFGEKGSNYAYMLENEIATNYFIKALSYLENINEPLRKAIIKQKLANVYLKMENFSFASELYKEALQIMKEHKDIRNYSLTLVNYGYCLIHTQQYEKARKVLFEAIKGLKTFNSIELIGVAYGRIGESYMLEKRYSSAEPYLKQAYASCLTENSMWLVRMAANYITVLYNLKKYPEALKIISEINTLIDSDKFNIEDKMIFYQESAPVYLKTQKEALAIGVLQKVITFKDSIYNIDKERTIKNIQANFETNAQQEKNKFLEDRNVLLREKVNFTNKIQLLTAFMSIALILALLFALRVLFFRNKFNKMKLEVTSTEKKLIEKKHYLKIKESEKQKQTLTLRERELTSITLQLADLQTQIEEVAKQIDNKKPEDIKKSLLKIVKKYNYWEEFTLKFSLIHPNYVENLQHKYPELTRNDIDYICLLKLNLSNKEIATLLQISPESVITKKYRIKKKMNIEDEDLFNEKVLQLS